MRERSLGVRICVLIALTAVLLFSVGLFAQETTGGLQGTVKDANGAVVPKALVSLTGTSLVGAKSLETDAAGYYHFANLPPGTYSVTVKSAGFATLKRDGITIEVGHLPTLDLALKVGSQETVVEVSAEAPVIDVTTTRTLTNITEDVIQDVPHGRSFQSVIQFAPSARNEPLAGGSLSNNSAGGLNGAGNGGSSPGNGGNGQAYGFSVGGGADSENSYLVEGQDTANLIGGYSHTNVPFEFIQEVQVKSSGIEAEHGGSLGGVVNVIMKKGSNDWHGEVGGSYEMGALDGATGGNAYTRYNPTAVSSGQFDVPAQNYQPKRDHLTDIQPSAMIGGALVKDRVFAFFGFAPEYISRSRQVNFGASDGNAGLQTFERDQQTYYTNGRIDAKVTNKINIFGSWLYQFQRESGAVLPAADSTTGLYNPATSAPLYGYEHGYGYSAPNQTINVGGDITLTPRLVSTTRFGYYFENYHDFGYPTSGTLYLFQSSGQGALECTAADTTGNCTTGSPISSTSPLYEPNGYFTAGYDQNYTNRNADKHVQFDQDVAWFKSGWAGTHNFKFGYQLNRLSNDIYQLWSMPTVQVFPGQQYAASDGSYVSGTYGYFLVNDAGTKGKATSYNNAFFAQDAWTIGKGVTVNAGIRFEHENVPSENNSAGIPSNPIEFGWGSKIAPRIGAAWDVFRDGRMKVFGSYGVFYDMMKLNVAISSFGGQYWQNCAYTLNDPNFSDITASPDANQRYCNGTATTPALLSSTGTDNSFIENINFRGNEGTAPGLKPYRQHESVFGVDYQLRKDLAFEARWDRRRLDDAIEDSALYGSAGTPEQGSETFMIVNPGKGVNTTFNGFYNALYGTTGSVCADCPNEVKAERQYDGVEFRLTKTISNHWFGMFSYTYSSLRGNYSGLTSTDLSDGGGGRNSPNNSRAFDEPYFQWTANGTPFNGPLNTDRPNTFKGYAYYQLNEGKRSTTNIGWFQSTYQGTPLSSYIDVGYWSQPGAFPVYVEGRGKWADISQDPTSGLLSVDSVGTRRTPWYWQSDASLMQEFKVNPNNERQVLGFEMIVSNLLNQHSVTSYGSQIDSLNTGSYLTPGGIPFYYGAPAYSAYMHPYDWKGELNSAPIVLDSQYGKPWSYELPRTIRFRMHFTF